MSPQLSSGRVEWNLWGAVEAVIIWCATCRPGAALFIVKAGEEEWRAVEEQNGEAGGEGGGGREELLVFGLGAAEERFLQWRIKWSERKKMLVCTAPLPLIDFFLFQHTWNVRC